MMNVGTRGRRWFCKSVAAGAIGLPFISTRGLAETAKTLRAVMQADIQVLDPIVNMAGSGSRIAHTVFETLFALDSNLAAQPQMVGEHELSTDGLTYTFVLRPGLKFHDGMPVTA